MARGLRLRTVAVDAVFLMSGIACCYVFAYAAAVGRWIGYDGPDDAINLGLMALAMGASLFAFESLRIVLKIRTRAVSVWSRRRQESGSIIVEFALAFPLLLWMLSMTFQMALFANASLITKYAAFAAARAAAVSTERQWGVAPIESISSQGDADARLAAQLVLATISPWNSRSGGDQAGQAIYETVGRQSSVYVNSSYPKRVDYAKKNTTFTFDVKQPPVNPLASALASIVLPPEFTNLMVNPIGNREVYVKIDYKLYLVIPGIDLLPGMPVVPVQVRGAPARAMVVSAAHQIPTTGPREGHPLQGIWVGWFFTALSPSDSE
ncbi:MAG: pilus assembly protein [Phycisphaerales bacterium]|nr:pilus assembly protein [Phycisphaerales bacterium]